MNILEAIAFAAETIAAAGIANARREASSLLVFVLLRDSAFLIAHPEYVLTDSEALEFEAAVCRRADREPFQHITGVQEFYGLEFEVSSDVLIPRPETEILVAEAIALLSGVESPAFYEVGVGSGCIAVSILHEVPTATGAGVDISPDALSVAARNAEKHSVAARLRLFQGDIFDEAGQTFDLIVSNPPYIPDNKIDQLQPEVGRFDPHTALFGGPDGLAITRRIIAGAPQFLKPKGSILIEIDFDQSAAVKELFDPQIWKDVEFLEDLQGFQRIAKARLIR
ncbi:MAG: peptide chain release factor N(5)-glutamine methyltransferase [Acidobacteriota bacterium]